MSNKRLFWVVAACLVVWAAFLPFRGVWAPDEARYAEVTREMAQNGDWLIPKLNGTLYTQKPPLFFDLARLASLPAGSVHTWAVKVPSLLGGVLTLLFVGLLGLELIGSKGVWLAPLLLGSMFKFAWQAQFGQIDMLLTGLIVAQVYIGLRVAGGRTPRLPGILSLAVLGAAGVLAKGAVGCLLPWLVLLCYFAARHDRTALKRLGLQWVVPAVLALSALWLGTAGLVEGWHYPHALLFHQSIQRYFEPWHHKAPFYYYFGVLFTDGLPYSLLLVPAAFQVVRRRAWKHSAALLPLVWMGVYLLFFSLSEGKRSVYILPLFPAMALLLAYGILELDTPGGTRIGFEWAFVVLAALFLGLGAYGFAQVPAQYRSVRLPIAAGALLLTAGCLIALLLAKRHRTLPGVSVMAVSALLFMLVTGLPVVRALDHVKAPAALAKELEPVLNQGGRLAVYPTLVPSVNYYTRTTTPVFARSEKALAVRFLLEGDGHRLLVREDAWPSIPAGALVHLQTIFIGDDAYWLLAPNPHERQGVKSGVSRNSGGTGKVLQGSEGTGR